MNNELNVQSLFPTCVSFINKIEYLSSAKKIFDEYSLLSQSENGINPIYPVVMTRNMTNDERVKELADYILNTAWNVLDYQGYKMDLFYTQFMDLWGQEHRRGSGMDYHIHGFNSQISGFYFIEVPDNSSEIIFYDPRPTKVYADLPQKDVSQHTYATGIYSYKPKAGDLYFHNSWLPHSFTKNNNLEPIKFIHFNIVTIPRHFVDEPNESRVKQPIVV